MEYIDVIKARRSIRKYTDELVSDQLVMHILETAILAPSAKNRQPWYFKKLEKNEIIKISELLFKRRKKEDISIEMTAKIISEINCLILVCTENDAENINDILSLGACIEHICLTATDVGLGSLWIGHILKVEDEIKKLLNLDKKIVAAVALGYPNQFPNPRPRKSLEEVLL